MYRLINRTNVDLSIGSLCILKGKDVIVNELTEPMRVEEDEGRITIDTITKISVADEISATELTDSTGGTAGDEVADIAKSITGLTDNSGGTDGNGTIAEVTDAATAADAVACRNNST